MDQLNVCKLSKNFVLYLLELNNNVDIMPLLHPDNVIIGEDKITLRETNPNLVPRQIAPGYSAPELYNNQPSPASAVYFLGALMYTLTANSPPPAAVQRPAQNAPVLQDGSPLAVVINKAMEPSVYSRYQNLPQLLEGINWVIGQYENAPQTQAAAPNVPPAATTMQAPAQMGENSSGSPPAGGGVPNTSAQSSQVPPAQPMAPGGQGPAAAVPPAPTIPPVPNVPPAPAQPGYQAGAPGPRQNISQVPVSGHQPPPSGQYQQGGVQPASIQKPAKPKKKKTGLIVILIIIGLLVILGGAFFGYTAYQSNNIDVAFAQGNYPEVVRMVESTPWLEGSKENEYKYAQAKILINAGNTDEAISILEGISSFSDSKSIVDGLKYEKAIALMNAGSLEESRQLLESLGDYQDSAVLREDLRLYLEADAMADGIDKFYAFNNLGGFLDSEARASQMAGAIYDSAIQEYTNGNISLALESFWLIPEYEDSGNYIRACEIWNSASDMSSMNRDYLPELQELANTINLEPIMMSNRFFMIFLESNWTSPDGGGSMNIGLETFDFSDFDLGNQQYAFRDRKITGDEGDVFSFEYITYNEVRMTVVETGEVFTYQRN